MSKLKQDFERCTRHLLDYRNGLKDYINIQDIREMIQEYLTNEEDFELGLYVLVRRNYYVHEIANRLARMLQQTKHIFVIRWMKVLKQFITHNNSVPGTQFMGMKMKSIVTLVFCALSTEYCNRPWCWIAEDCNCSVPLTKPYIESLL